MPAAELFGSVAIASPPSPPPSAHPRVSAVHAITDCAPAASVINSATSGIHQLRHIIRIAHSSLSSTVVWSPTVGVVGECKIRKNHALVGSIGRKLYVHLRWRESSRLVRDKLTQEVLSNFV